MRTTLMIFASCFALAGASVARAEEPDVAALQQQVRQLRQTVLELQKRVDRLEGRRAPAAQAAPVAALPLVVVAVQFPFKLALAHFGQ